MLFKLRGNPAGGEEKIFGEPGDVLSIWFRGMVVEIACQSEQLSPRSELVSANDEQQVKLRKQHVDWIQRRGNVFNFKSNFIGSQLE